MMPHSINLHKATRRFETRALRQHITALRPSSVPNCLIYEVAKIIAKPVYAQIIQGFLSKCRKTDVVPRFSLEFKELIVHGSLRSIL